MVTTDVFVEPTPALLNEVESAAFFEARVQEVLGIGTEEFLQRLHAGEYDQTLDEPENWDVLHLAMMVRGGP